MGDDLKTYRELLVNHILRAHDNDVEPNKPCDICNVYCRLIDGSEYNG